MLVCQYRLAAANIRIYAGYKTDAGAVAGAVPCRKTVGRAIIASPEKACCASCL